MVPTFAPVLRCLFNAVPQFGTPSQKNPALLSIDQATIAVCLQERSCPYSERCGVRVGAVASEFLRHAAGSERPLNFGCFFEEGEDGCIGVANLFDLNRFAE
jgi:hypothetical protein